MKFSDFQDLVFKKCCSNDYTMYMYVSDNYDIRFAQNAITQNIAGKSKNYTLNTAFGKKTGTASVNTADSETIDYLIDTSCQIAKLSEEDPEYLPGCKKIDLPVIKNYYSHTADLRPGEMYEILQKIIEFAKSHGATASGIISKYIEKQYIASKNGFYSEMDSTKFCISTTIKKGDLETKVKQSYLNYQKFSLDGFIDKLYGQFKDLCGDVRVMPRGRYAVILRPCALAQFFSFMMFFMDQKAADRGLTFFSGKLEKQIAGNNFSISSSIKDPDLESVSNFYECEPASDIDWIMNGVLKNLSLDRFYAQKSGKKPCYPYNMLIKGGPCGEEEMIKKVKRGLIVNNLWYIRNIDIKRGELTGMTRDGVLYFEDGEIKGPVRNFRFNEVMLEVASRVLETGPAELVNTRYKAPSMLMNDFNFVDTVSF